VNLGLDYSAGRPGGAAIAAAGYTFVMRYLDNGIHSGRVNIDAAEFTDLRAHSVAVGLVWESQADRATGGAAAGTADAHAALASAAAIGASGWPIYFAVDFDIPDYAPGSADPLAKLGPVGQYLLAVRAVLGFWYTGVYGGYYAVHRALDAGCASLSWQTLAWSGNQVDGRIQLLQRLGSVTVGGVACDVNEQHTDYFGQSAITPAVTTSPGDIVFEFVCNTDTFSGTNLSDHATTNPHVLQLLGGGYAVPATWADVQAKDKAYGGDGTGSVLGKAAADYQVYVDLDAAVRARDAHLTGLGSAGTAGATPAEVQTIVDAAFADHDATLTYNKITGS
jgi:hypothetical protein